MPHPDSALTTLRPELATIMEWELAASRQGFIGYRIFPVTPTEKSLGPFKKIPDHQLLRSQSTERAAGAGYGRDDFQFEDDSFETKEYGFEGQIEDSESKMYSSFFDFETVVAARTMDAVLREAEERCAALMTGLTGAGTTAASNVWSAAAGTPVTDVKAARVAIRNACGREANCLAVDWELFDDLRHNDEIIDISKSQSFADVRAKSLNEMQVAMALNLDEVLVAGAGAMTNSANDSTETLTLAPIWDKTEAYLFVRAETTDNREVAIGRTYAWTEENGTITANGVEPIVEEYEEPATRSRIMRSRIRVQEKELYGKAAHIITAV